MLNILNLNNRPGRQRGFALLIVLTSVLIVAILANIILSVVLNQARLTRHRVSRIQAYYAAQMGMIHAMAKLKSGWIPTNPDTRYIYNRVPCPSADTTKCTLDDMLPPSVNTVTMRVYIDGSGPYTGLYNITSTANYTYNNP